MPQYVLAEGLTPLDHLRDQEISELLQKFGLFAEKLSPRVFNYKDKWRIFDTLLELSGKGDGEIIKPEIALQRCDNFTQNPRFLNIGRDVLESFWEKVVELKNRGKYPAENEIGLRLYVGRNFSNEYGIVVVPMHGPKPIQGQPRDRSNEKEKSFFTDSAYPFFALMASSSGIKVSNSESECLSVILHKDTIGKEVVCFSEEAFLEFKKGLKTPYSSMRVSFARTSRTGFVTLVMMFLDSNNIPIESNGTFFGVTAQGIFFDQGDLIPPPPQNGIADSSFK